MRIVAGVITAWLVGCGIIFGTDILPFNPQDQWTRMSGTATQEESGGLQSGCIAEDKEVDLWGRHTIGETVTLQMHCRDVEHLSDPYPLTLDGFDLDVSTEGTLWVNDWSTKLFPPGNTDCDEFENPDPTVGLCTYDVDVPRSALKDGDNLVRFVHDETSGFKIFSIQGPQDVRPPTITPIPGAVIELSTDDYILATTIADGEGNWEAWVDSRQATIAKVTVLGKLCPLEGTVPPDPTPPPNGNGNDNSNKNGNSNGNTNDNDNGSVPPDGDDITVCGDGSCDHTSIKEAVAAAQPGDTVLVRRGVYTSGTTKRSTTAVYAGFKHDLVLRGEPGAIIEGHQGETDILMYLEGCENVVVEGFEFRNGRRTAIVIDGACRDITVQDCSASGFTGDPAYTGGAFRVVGPAERITLRRLISHNNDGGIELREKPTKNNGQANIPNNLTDWTAERGFSFGANDVLISECLVFNNTETEEHSDGIQARYATNVVVENCIVYDNADDGIDLLGCTYPSTLGNIVFNHHGNGDGDGNGIKIGVRGAIGVIAEQNIVFDNDRGGIDVADSLDAIVRSNTIYNNNRWFGIWTEASAGDVHQFTNNIVHGHTKGDVGCNGGITPQLFTDNWIGDGSPHNWVCTGTDNVGGSDPGFTNSSLGIDTSCTDLSPIECMMSIRQQVENKLGLVPNAPAAGKGAIQ